MQATLAKPGYRNTEHDAIPEPYPRLGLQGFGMTQLRSVFAVSEVKNA